MSTRSDPFFGLSFYQQGPKVTDLFTRDEALQAELRARLPSPRYEEAVAAAHALSAVASGEMQDLATLVEANPPAHVPYTPWGKRVDDIVCHPAWKRLQDIAAEHRVVAAGHDDSLGDRARVVQAMLMHLYSGSSAVFSCPLAMTDAAARVLRDQAPAEVRDALYPRLTSTDPDTMYTSGQWMTERTGGSDVSGTSTRAVPDAAGGFRLHGVKWFTSSTTSEMALTLGRIDDGRPATEQPKGSRGLTMFCVEVKRDADGALEGIQVNRLKDKLGTKALPTAELTLEGVKATQIGAEGRGVANIATMLNITRFWNALASTSAMARASNLAASYAKERVAFGKAIAEQPLHQTTLRALDADAAGALSLAFEVADLLGRSEHGTATPGELSRLRGLLPIAKLTLGKQVVSHASEALEAFGGAGYIEDTGLPRLLRDAQVLSIWEGTTNVLALDVLRADAKDQSLSAVLSDLAVRAEKLAPAGERNDVHAATAAVRAHVAGLVRRVRGLSKAAAAGELALLERHARRIALSAGYALEAVRLAEVAAWAPDVERALDRYVDFVDLRLHGPLGLTA